MMLIGLFLSTLPHSFALLVYAFLCVGLMVVVGNVLCCLGVYSPFGLYLGWFVFVFY